MTVNDGVTPRGPAGFQSGARTPPPTVVPGGAAAPAPPERVSAGEGEDDWELLRKSSTDDPSAFGRLVERHYRPSVAFCTQVIGDAHKAEDIVQRGFLNLFRARDRYRERARFRTFLYRILLNLCLNELQRKSVAASFSSLSSDGEQDPAARVRDGNSPDPAAVAEIREAEAMMGRALAQLRPEHRAALWLREHDGLAYQEISAALGASLGEVKIWIHRARKRLIELLRPYVDRGESVP